MRRGLKGATEFKILQGVTQRGYRVQHFTGGDSKGLPSSKNVIHLSGIVILGSGLLHVRSGSWGAGRSRPIGLRDVALLCWMLGRSLTIYCVTIGFTDMCEIMFNRWEINSPSILKLNEVTPMSMKVSDTLLEDGNVISTNITKLASQSQSRNKLFDAMYEAGFRASDCISHKKDESTATEESYKAFREAIIRGFNMTVQKLLAADTKSLKKTDVVSESKQSRTTADRKYWQQQVGSIASDIKKHMRVREDRALDAAHNAAIESGDAEAIAETGAARNAGHNSMPHTRAVTKIREAQKILQTLADKEDFGGYAGNKVAAFLTEATDLAKRIEHDLVLLAVEG
jgi:hypothetical protein